MMRGGGTPLAEEAGEISTWHQIVAVGVLIGDLRPEAISRYAAVSTARVLAALDTARAEALVEGDQAVNDSAAQVLLEALGTRGRLAVHAAVARHLVAAEPDHLDEILGHARGVADVGDRDAMATAVERAGITHLTLADPLTARRFFTVAVELDGGLDSSLLARRLILLGRSLQALGEVEAGRSHFARAFALAEMAGDGHLAARAAVRFAFPVDFHAGDQRAVALLRRAQAMTLGEDDDLMVTAALGMVEMRIPMGEAEDHQFAWVTRPDVAQPLTESALERAGTDRIESRVISLVAWRSTHRSPAHLTQRREVTAELVELAHRFGDASLAVIGAGWAAVDAIESGDRVGYDRYRAQARWLAESEPNPALRWRVLAAASGAAHLDGDVDAAVNLAREAWSQVEGQDSSRWDLAHVILDHQVLIARDDPDAFEPAVADPPLAARMNPVAQADLAYFLARRGSRRRSTAMLERAVRRLDPESSILLVGSRAIAAAVEIGHRPILETLVEVLEPWADHVVVDAHAWWVDGSVAYWLAQAHSALGRPGRAHDLLPTARRIAMDIGDVRTRGRLAQLNQLGDGSSSATTGGGGRVAGLTERELQVLTLMAQGASNPEIAKTLCFSVSTIRNDTISIYRKFDVRTRASAVAAATRLGVLAMDEIA